MFLAKVLMGDFFFYLALIECYKVLLLFVFA